MYLKKLDLAGFKSFAERVSLSFGSGLNAVVGPNGSGKSNIADALRWVLGEQSAKQLRGHKMEDVIFSGTAHRKPLGFAEIVMRIDNSDNALPDPGTPEVVVTRRVYRSGESEFSINGTPCRLKDIQQLFMDTGIGRDGYSIIGQGRVDEILSVKSEDRRLIFEEAAGISKFKARRHETLTRLTREGQNRARVADIIAELDEQIEPLAEQAETARRYLALRDQYKQTHIALFLHEIHRIDAELAKNEKALAHALAQSADGRSRLSMAREAEEKLKTQAAEADTRYRRASEALLEVTTNIERKIGEENQLVTNRNRLTDEQIRLRGEADRRDTALNDREAEQKAEEATRAAAEEKLNELTTELASHADLHTQYEAEEEENTRALAAHNADILAQGNTVTEHKAIVLDAESRYRRFEEDKERLDAEIEQTEENLSSQEEVLEHLRQAHSTAVQEATRADAQVTALTQALEALTAERQGVEEEYITARESLSAARAKHRALTDLHSQHEGYYRSVRAVLRKRESDAGFAGVCGAVGELINVPDGYATAIEIALGSATQHIVTQTEDDAKHAIEYLKKSGEGRATFLPLTAVKGKTLDPVRVAKEAGYIGIAAQLISCEKAYTGVVAQLLGDVIVVDNLDNATAIHRKYKYSYKVVTLDGERLSPGGAMTGGSVAQNAGGLLGRSHRLSELAKELTKLEKSYDALAAEYKAQTEKYTATDEALHRARERAQALHGEAQSASDRCALVAQGLQALRDTAANHAAANDAIMAQLVAGNQAIRDAKNALSAQGEALTAAHTRLAEYQRTLAEKRASHLEESDVLTELRVEISRQKELQNAANVNLARIARETAILTEEKNIILAEIEACQVKIHDADTQHSALKKDLESLQANRQETQETLSAAEAAKAQLDTAISKVEADERGHSDETSLLERELTRLEIRKEQLHATAHRLNNEMWEEYGLTHQTAMAYQSAPEQQKEKVTESSLRREAGRLRSEIAELGDVNVGAIEAYKQLKTRHDFLSAQHDDILQAEDALKELIATLTAQMEEQFLTHFQQIAKHFNDVFREMFGGGHASLRLSDEANLLESGIEITAQPPGKTLQTLLLLSGGERALTAIALLFAILRMKPSPFCVLDEIESALDDANVTRFAQFLKQYTAGTQFILITHRKGTMEAADHLYGVTMQEQGVSKLVSVRFAGEV